jgi:hypothetical protein
MKQVISIKDWKMKIALGYIQEKYGYEKGILFKNGEFYPTDDKKLERILGDKQS